MYSSNPAVKARTCPVCWLHFDSLSRCAGHIKSKHPTPPVTSTTNPTSAAVLQQWELFVDAVYPGYLRVMHNASKQPPQQPPTKPPRQKPPRTSWAPAPTEDSDDSEFQLLDFKSASRK